ncbi:MAG: TonB-dependent receptor plug domain-containing protein, partial [Cytophagales bacterium]|nr:TonB-dependent receptor plug domain-containing protein [Cytophagales bacterium]
MKKNSTYYLFMVLFLMLNGTIMAQQIYVQGKVTAAEDPEGLPGVSIVAEGTGTGTVSDINGNFSINVPNENTVLVFSYIGYASQSITIGNQQTLNVVMQPEAKGLDEFIVTAFGISQEKKSLGYSAQNIDAEAITKVKQPNLVNSLQGQAAGVQITNSGGAPGQSARIIIRGINSLDPGANNQPLFVVDGVPVDNSTIESTGTPRGLSNRMADLNPNDVASISVLKGAAATALYGVRAANGAVIVTTKKGKEGEVRVNYNGSVGFETLNQLPKLQDEYGQGFSGEYQPSSFWPAWGAPIAEVQQTVADHKYQDNWRRAFNRGVQI